MSFSRAGLLRRIKNASRKIKSQGYTTLVIYEHRLAWLIHYGTIPKGFHIHHINGKRADNRIRNLAAMDPAHHNRLGGNRHIYRTRKDELQRYCGMCKKWFSFNKTNFPLCAGGRRQTFYCGKCFKKYNRDWMRAYRRKKRMAIKEFKFPWAELRRRFEDRYGPEIADGAANIARYLYRKEREKFREETEIGFRPVKKKSCEQEEIGDVVQEDAERIGDPDAFEEDEEDRGKKKRRKKK